MGAGALFHQTSLFRICRKANSSKCYRYGLGARLDAHGSDAGSSSSSCYYYYCCCFYYYDYYYYYYYYYYSETSFINYPGE